MKSVSKAVIALAVVAVMIAAGALVAARPGSPAAHVLTDGAAIRVPAEVAAVRRVLWNPARPIPMIAGEPEGESDAYEPRISADGARMVYVKRRPGSNADLFVSRWTPAGWSAAEAITEINSSADELGPELSWDGRTLYFYSDRDGGLGGYDLWKSTRVEDAWGTPVNLGPEVNTEFNEYGPAESPDGQSLYFASNRPREGEARPTGEGWNATVRERRERHDYDLFRSELREGTAGTARRLAELDTLHDEGSPAVSPAGDFLYFASDRPGGVGGYDVYRSRILRGVHLAPENVGAGVNTPDNELDPGLSTDGFRLYFSTDRVLPEPAAEGSADVSAVVGEAVGAGAKAQAGARRYRVWFSDSREVFDEYATTPSDARLLEWWNAVWPWLAMLAAALLLGYLLLAMLRNPAWRRRFGRLSLLAQCVLVSLLIHAIAASVLAAWRVGTGIIDMVRHQGDGGGGNQVILTSSGAAGEVAGQVRGDGSAEPIVVPALMAMHAEIESPGLEPPTIRTELPASEGRRVESPAIAAQEAAADRATDAGRMELSRDAHEDVRTTVPEVAAGISVMENADAAAPALRPSAPALEGASRLDSMKQVGLPQRSSDVPDGAVRQETSDAAPATRGVELSLESATSGPAVRVPRDVRMNPEVSEAQGLPAAPRVAGLVASVEAGSSVGNLERVALPAATPAQGGVEHDGSTVVESDQGSRPISGERIGPDAGVRVASGGLEGARLPLVAEHESAVKEEAGARLAAVAMSSPTVGTAGTPAGEMQRVGMPPSAASGRGSNLGTIIAEAPVSATSAIASAASRGGTAAPMAPPTVGVPTLGEGGASERGETREASSLRLGAAIGSAPPVGPSGASSTTHSRVALGAGTRVDATLGKGDAGAPEATNAAPSSVARSGEIAAGSEPASAPAVALPALEPEVITPVETFAQRAPEVREKVLERMGGTADTEAAVRRALDWFKRHQEADGRWTGRRFDDECGHCDGGAAFDGDAAMTGMAMLCYLGAGHTHQSEGPYREVVSKALSWLVARQGPDGDVRRGEAMYGQTVSTVALCEAFSMTRDPKLAGPARRGVDFVVRVAGRTRGGAAPREEDTSVIGWLVMTVESARRAGISVPPDTFEAARKWLDYVSSTRNPGLYSYRKGDKPSLAMTAEAMFVQQLLGHGRSEGRMVESAAYLLRASPRWEQGAPTYCWYYATLALFEHQGDAWRQWNEALMPQLLEHQRRDEGADGSWDPQDEWSKMGGRIYQTAVCTLCLEVYYRYKPKGAGVTSDAGLGFPAPSTGP